MFLESNYQPKQLQSNSTLSIMDVAILTAQIGDKPFYKKGRMEHLTVGHIQLVCYFAQGIHMVQTGRSLFKENFYIVDDRLENSKITEVFGQYDKIVTPFNLDRSMIKYLSNKDHGFNTDNNKLVQSVIYEYVPHDYKEMMKEIRSTSPYIKAKDNELKRIEKNDIKEYFEHKILKTTVFKDIKIGE